MSKARPGTRLWRIGLWATIWWGVSGAYLLLLVWSSRQAYSDISTGSDSSGFFSDWFSASTETYQDSTLLQWLLLAVLAGWIIGAVFWLMELKRQKISYKSAFKDLFLTIRK